MSKRGAGPVEPTLTTEDLRVRIGMALGFLEMAAYILEKAPAPETALPLGDRQRYRYLLAAQTARLLLLGQEAGDCVDRPARDSALGAGQRIYEWNEEQTERHFENALRDWSEDR
ncbi:MAG TPA: hypothetical protein VLF66_11665 [Thermoanaerobaculia bacterium]|nr:hypothetical protein [Thermoanaerobaculia bacterium]